MKDFTAAEIIYSQVRDRIAPGCDAAELCASIVRETEQLRGINAHRELIDSMAQPVPLPVESAAEWRFRKALGDAMSVFAPSATSTLGTPGLCLECKRGAPDGTITGYASTFGPPPDSYGDIIERGAFTATLASWAAKGRLPPLLWQHDGAKPLGAITALREDSHGLALEARLLVEADPLARTALAHVQAGSVIGLSIGFQTTKFRPGTGDVRRYIQAVDLFEVSLVSIPANSNANLDS